MRLNFNLIYNNIVPPALSSAGGLIKIIKILLNIIIRIIKRRPLPRRLLRKSFLDIFI